VQPRLRWHHLSAVLIPLAAIGRTKVLHRPWICLWSWSEQCAISPGHACRAGNALTWCLARPATAGIHRHGGS